MRKWGGVRSSVIGTRGEYDGKGECSDGKSEGDVVKTSRWLSSKGECGDEEVEERKKYFVFN